MVRFSVKEKKNHIWSNDDPTKREQLSINGAYIRLLLHLMGLE